jgi:hypothetical protein
MIDYCAGALRQGNCSVRPGDIGAKSCNEDPRARADQLSCFGNCGIKRCGLT